jgi:hypothetical protein
MFKEIFLLDLSRGTHEMGWKGAHLVVPSYPIWSSGPIAFNSELCASCRPE